ncbi:hypothetical protein AQUCO_01600306v1 [Aquilegia coerulea]|uniref:Uncharacterized protein n=1 Tax=Aquilegia coerulea TaxID=218851 RepID=A0A2G5DR11_AQUCA|nr:hypothetical protein AQUCO_01600306v1 [Aquilegia coerulea]
MSNCSDTWWLKIIKKLHHGYNVLLYIMFLPFFCAYSWTWESQLSTYCLLSTVYYTRAISCCMHLKCKQRAASSLCPVASFRQLVINFFYLFIYFFRLVLPHL